VKSNVATAIYTDHAAGELEFERAKINWSLSINPDHLPPEAKNSGKRTYRSLKIEGREIEFSDGFTGLHTRCYEQVLAGNGFGIEEARPSIELVYHLRKTTLH
jgi:UDP-N-acetyl-2-amino-2-deoxyglucuronate dehydrogenase